MKIKFNSGIGAILCDGCSVIVYTGIDTENAGVPFDGTKETIRDNIDKLPRLHRHGNGYYCDTCHDGIEKRKAGKK